MRAPDPLDQQIPPFTDAEWAGIKNMLAKVAIDADTVKAGYWRGEFLKPLRPYLDGYREVCGWNWAADRKRRARELHQVLDHLKNLDLDSAMEYAPDETIAAQHAFAVLRDRLEHQLRVDPPRKGLSPKKEMRARCWDFVCMAWDDITNGRRLPRKRLIEFLLAVTPSSAFEGNETPESRETAIRNYLDQKRANLTPGRKKSA